MRSDMGSVPDPKISKSNVYAATLKHKEESADFSYYASYSAARVRFVSLRHFQILNIASF